MFDKLDFILEKYEELSHKVSDPRNYKQSGGVAKAYERNERNGAYCK